MSAPQQHMQMQHPQQLKFQQQQQQQQLWGQQLHGGVGSGPSPAAAGPPPPTAAPAPSSLQQLATQPLQTSLSTPTFAPLFPVNGTFLHPTTAAQQQQQQQLQLHQSAHSQLLHQQQPPQQHQQPHHPSHPLHLFAGAPHYAMNTFAPSSSFSPLYPHVNKSLDAAAPASAATAAPLHSTATITTAANAHSTMPLPAMGLTPTMSISQRLSASCPYCANVFAYEFPAASSPNGLDVLCPFCRQAVKLPMTAVHGHGHGQGQDQTQRNLYLDSNGMLSPHFLSAAPLLGSYSLQQQQQPQQQQTSPSLLVHPTHALSAAPFVSSNMAAAALGVKEMADQEDAYYSVLGAFANDFNNPRSALVWLSRAVPSRTGKLAVPRGYRLPKSSAGQGGYCTAFNALGLCLREADTSTGHWHSWYVEPRRVALKAMQKALMRRWRESPNFQEAYLLLDPSADIDAIQHADSSTTMGASVAAAATAIAPASSVPLSSPSSDAAVSTGARSTDVAHSGQLSATATPCDDDGDGKSDDGIDSQTARDVTMALASFFQRQSPGGADAAADAGADAQVSCVFSSRAWALKDSTLLACIRAARNFNSTLPVARQSADQSVTAAKSDKQADHQPMHTSLSADGLSDAHGCSKKRKHDEGDDDAMTVAAPAAAAPAAPAASAVSATSVASSSRPPSMSSFSSEPGPSTNSGSFPSTITADNDKPPALSTDADSPRHPASLAGPDSPLMSASPHSGASTQKQLYQPHVNTSSDTDRLLLPPHKRRIIAISSSSDSATESRPTAAVTSLAQVAIAAASGAADADTVIHARRLAELEAAQQAQLYLQCHAQSVGTVGNSATGGASALSLSSPTPSPPLPLLPPSDLSQSLGGHSGAPLPSVQPVQLSHLSSGTSASPASGAAAASKAQLLPSPSPLSPLVACDGVGASGALPSTQLNPDTAIARA